MSQTVPSWLAQALGPPRSGHAGLAIARLADERSFGRGGFAGTSPAFRAGEALDPCFTADEEDAVAPPLEWTAPPPGAQEVVLIVEDADAGASHPFCHWLVWGLPGILISALVISAIAAITSSRVAPGMRVMGRSRAKN